MHIAAYAATDTRSRRDNQRKRPFPQDPTACPPSPPAPPAVPRTPRKEGTVLDQENR